MGDSQPSNPLRCATFETSWVIGYGLLGYASADDINSSVSQFVYFRSTSHPHAIPSRDLNTCSNRGSELAPMAIEIPDARLVKVQSSMTRGKRMSSQIRMPWKFHSSVSKQAGYLSRQVGFLGHVGRSRRRVR
ncbi:hypothetical protein Pdw03_5081 [Penicillium digitatum]|uniref:Uncharacterized protein n=1 Tax=Penicillium digitatum TaxID=36651 RepID=A0A7T7BPL6_PENDI|nr:hypothetical protein Pdw03_5081 [Penicillium digitatum]